MDSEWLRRFRDAQSGIEREKFSATPPANDCACGRKCHGEKCLDCHAKDLNALRSPHYRKTLDQ